MSLTPSPIGESRGKGSGAPGIENAEVERRKARPAWKESVACSSYRARDEDIRA